MGWYQGMFEQRIQELYPSAGLTFIKNVQKRFPSQGPQHSDQSAKISAVEVVQELEEIAPGFQAWAKGFGD